MSSQLEPAEGTVVVAGGTRGIGLACVEAFIKAGRRVFFTGRNNEVGNEAARRLSGAATFIKQDVAQESDWDRLFADVRRSGAQVSTLVNCAGAAEAGRPGGISELDVEEWSRILSVNVTGTALGCKYAIREMQERGGVIVNLASTAGLGPQPALPAYGASKAAVAHLTRSVALYCSSMGIPVRCNAVSPGPVSTDLLTQLVDASARNIGSSPELLTKQVLAKVPLKRLGDPSEIAEAVLFVCSARWMTGTNLVIDGGRLLM